MQELRYIDAGPYRGVIGQFFTDWHNFVPNFNRVPNGAEARLMHQMRAVEIWCEENFGPRGARSETGIWAPHSTGIVIRPERQVEILAFKMRWV